MAAFSQYRFYDKIPIELSHEKRFKCKWFTYLPTCWALLIGVLSLNNFFFICWLFWCWVLVGEIQKVFFAIATMLMMQREWKFSHWVLYDDNKSSLGIDLLYNTPRRDENHSMMLIMNRRTFLGRKLCQLRLWGKFLNEISLCERLSIIVYFWYENSLIGERKDLCDVNGFDFWNYYIRKNLDEWF